MLTLYMPRLPMGGIERATVTLANHWAATGRRVTILLDRREGDLLRDISPEVPVGVLGAARTAWALPKLVVWLRRNRPAVLHSALPHNSVVALMAGRLTGTRVTVAEHSLMRDKIRIDRQVALLAPLMRRLYPRAAVLMAPSEAVADDLRTVIGVLRKAIHIVGNPVVADNFDPDRLVRPPTLPADGQPIFVAAGRLVPVKDFPTLLRAFRRVLDQRPAHLIILGEGPERQRLSALAAELGLGGRFSLPGVVADPFSTIAHAAALVVSSITEGFGNTIVEAMACGTPIAATRCGAPVALLRNGELGSLALVGDPESLSRAMLAALDQPPDPSRLRAAARQFTVSAVAQRYEAALADWWQS
jgi:glycosyltransferase involved in cell wall biosynthesis